MGQLNQPPALSELEREVMEQVWSAACEVTVRDVMSGVNGMNEKQRAYTTVMTILSRLEAKGMLSKRKLARSDRFSPTISRTEYLQARAKVEVDALVGEYGEIARALFMREIENSDPSAVEKLRQLAEESDS